jgi:hypothetical protein
LVPAQGVAPLQVESLSMSDILGDSTTPDSFSNVL